MLKYEGFSRRDRERELIHTEKQVERQRIYNKYQLPNCTKKIKGAYTSSQGAKDGSQVRPPQNAYRNVFGISHSASSSQ